MIESSNDIIGIIKIINEESKNDIEYHLVLKDDDLDNDFWKLSEAGYLPEILFQAGRVSKLLFKLNDIKFISQAQQLVPC